VSTLRISTPTQQGLRLSWGSELFQQCSNIVERPSQVIEAVPVPVVSETTWQEWNDAVLALQQPSLARVAA